MDNLAYLFVAYASVWLVLAGYLWRLSRRAKALEEELARLRGLQVEADRGETRPSDPSRDVNPAGKAQGQL